MKFITLHLSQSRARIVLRSRALLRSPSVLFTVGVVSVSRCASRRSLSTVIAARSRSHLRKILPPHEAACRVVMRCVYGRRGRRTKRRTKTKRRPKRSGKKTSRERRTDEETRASLGRAGREETEIEKGRGRWRLQGYTRPEQGPASASERTSECAR